MSYDIGSDHCRVSSERAGTTGFSRFEFFRHLFAYHECQKNISFPGSILEIGCGEGYGADYLVKSGNEVVATDFDPQALSYAGSKYPEVRFCAAHGTKLPFLSDTFDFALSFQVIEHIKDDNAFLKEVFRVLKPAGVFFLTTPNRRLRLLPFQKPWNTCHVREYSDIGLKKLFYHNSFDVQMSGVSTKPEFLTMEINRVKQSPAKLILKSLYSTLNKYCGLPGTEMLRKKFTNKHQRADTDFAGETVLTDFFTSFDTRRCLDLFVIARKK